MFEAVLTGLSLASEASRTNLFGLGPIFCVQPSWSILALTFIFGFGFGACLVAYLAWTFLQLPPHSAPGPRVDFRSPTPRSVLSEYLDEPAFHSRRRNYRA